MSRSLRPMFGKMTIVARITIPTNSAVINEPQQTQVEYDPVKKTQFLGYNGESASNSYAQSSSDVSISLSSDGVRRTILKQYDKDGIVLLKAIDADGVER